jgi:quercetin dioxygenase-like cupin family protein
MAEQLVEDPVGRQRYVFSKAQEDGTEVLHAEGWVDPGGRVPPHVHPLQEERFHILEGEMTFTVGRSKQVTRAGETAVVPRGTRHAFHNTSGQTVHMRVDAVPALDLQEFLEDAAAAGREGLLLKLGPFSLPKGPKGLLRMAVVLRKHRDQTVLGMPPPLVQRLLIFPLAPFAERSGYSAR